MKIPALKNTARSVIDRFFVIAIHALVHSLSTPIDHSEITITLICMTVRRWHPPQANTVLL